MCTKRFVPMFVILALVALQLVAEAKPPTKGPNKASIDKLTKECETVADAALPEEVSNTSAILSYSGLDTVSKAEAGALVKVIRAIKTGNRKTMNELEHGTKSKPSIMTVMRPQMVGFFKELAYFMWVSKGEVKDDARDNCFTKGFVMSMYVSNWGNPHINEECAKKVRAQFFHSEKDGLDDYGTDAFVTAMQESKVIKDCTVVDEHEVAVRQQRFCSARLVFKNLSGEDPLQCTND